MLHFLFTNTTLLHNYAIRENLTKLYIWQYDISFFSNYNHVNYSGDNRVTFSHLFLRNWDATREVNSYPPAAGPLAIYQKKDFFATIDYAYNGYVHVAEAIGNWNEHDKCSWYIYTLSRCLFLRKRRQYGHWYDIVPLPIQTGYNLRI